MLWVKGIVGERRLDYFYAKCYNRIIYACQKVSSKNDLNIEMVLCVSNIAHAPMHGVKSLSFRFGRAARTHSKSGWKSVTSNHQRFALSEVRPALRPTRRLAQALQTTRISPSNFSRHPTLLYWWNAQNLLSLSQTHPPGGHVRAPRFPAGVHSTRSRSLPQPRYCAGNAYCGHAAAAASSLAAFPFGV